MIYGCLLWLGLYFTGLFLLFENAHLLILQSFYYVLDYLILFDLLLPLLLFLHKRIEAILYHMLVLGMVQLI
jgi:hypothetical protein